MDRRREPRYPTDLEVRVTELTRQCVSGPARLTNISKSGVALSVLEPLAPGDIVRLEIADSLLFGHVVHSSLGPGGYNVGIEMERVIFGGSDLSRLLRSVLEEQRGAETPAVRIPS